MAAVLLKKSVLPGSSVSRQRATEADGRPEPELLGYKCGTPLGTPYQFKRSQTRTESSASTNEAIGLAVTFTPNNLQLQKHTDNISHM